MHAVCIVSCLHRDIPVAVGTVESDVDVSVHLRLTHMLLHLDLNFTFV